MTDDVLTIRTESTPNPNSLKYHVGKLLIPGGSAHFPDAESAKGYSPLAERLFDVSGITAVFIGSDFFTLNREEGIEWQAINEGVAPALEDFFDAGDPVLSAKQAKQAPVMEDDEADAALIEQVQQLLDEKIRPAVAQDGGDIIYRGFKEGVVYLEMYGACAGCPSATMTLKDGVESMLRHHIDAVKEVRAL